MQVDFISQTNLKALKLRLSAFIQEEVKFTIVVKREDDDCIKREVTANVVDN